jgi:hypothetical protein
VEIWRSGVWRGGGKYFNISISPSSTSQQFNISSFSHYSMEGYLRGYYGYKNFGDELLFFGVVKQLSIKYPLTKLFVEVGDVAWMEDWVWENYQGILTEQQLKIIRFVDSKQHRYKWINHLIIFLG